MVKYSQSRSAVLNPKAKTERKNKPCADSQDLEGGQLSPLKLSSISLTAAVWKGAHHAAGMFLAIPPPGHPVGVSQSIFKRKVYTAMAIASRSERFAKFHPTRSKSALLNKG
jgi:hypothetical protein